MGLEKWLIYTGRNDEYEERAYVISDQEKCRGCVSLGWHMVIPWIDIANRVLIEE